MHLSQEMFFFTAYQRLSHKHMTLTLIQWFSKAVALIFHCMVGLPREMKNWTVSSNNLRSGAENSFPHRRRFWTLFFFFFLNASESVGVKVKFKVLILLWAWLSSWYNFSKKSCGSAAFLRERNMLGCCGPWWSYPLQFLNSLKYVDLEDWSITDWSLAHVSR